MSKSLCLSTALLSIVLLMSPGSVSARTGGIFVPTPGSAAQIEAFASAVNPTQILSLWASSIYTGGRDGDREDDKDKDKDKEHARDDHTPTPEPSTILSFGAALLIGGGLLYSRQLRRNRK